jgi:hypothetical protein
MLFQPSLMFASLDVDHKHRTRLNKYSSLLGPYVSYEEFCITLAPKTHPSLNYEVCVLPLFKARSFMGDKIKF